MTTKRSFVAVELPDDALDALLEVGRRLREACPDWSGEKWAPRQTLHVTLKFLGDVEPAGLDALTLALTARLGTTPLYSFTLDRLRAVPSHGRARMLWAIPAEQPTSLAAIAAAVEEASVALGMEPSDKAFTTHVTLVRARRPRRIDADTLAEAWTGAGHGDTVAGRPERAGGKTADRNVSGSVVTVFTSTLTPTGPIHEVWSRVPLCGV